MTKDGKPYGPIKYKEIIKQCYYISKHIHTSYNELLQITPIERLELLNLISKEIESQNKANEEFAKSLKQHNKK